MHQTVFTQYSRHLEELFALAEAAADEGLFNDLARELFYAHYQHNKPYRRLCDARGLTPQKIEDWHQIPAMPAAAYKEYAVTCLGEEDRTHWFESSGTTAQQRSRNYHNELSLRIYERSLLLWLKRQLPLELGQYAPVVLSPSVEGAPHSSLVHMFETVCKAAGGGSEVFCARANPAGDWLLDVDLCSRQLSRIGGKPALVMGTAFSYVHLLELGIRPTPLPAGSVLFETGGYKGRSRALPRAELHKNMARFFGVPERSVLSEYGMSELSSQAYHWHAAEPAKGYVFPPWARARIISAESGAEVRVGEVGLIEIVDLANVCSVLAIRTEDLGARSKEGFELIGRAALSEARGCSLSLAENQP